MRKRKSNKVQRAAVLRLFLKRSRERGREYAKQKLAEWLREWSR